jgi:RNA polymerase sigma-70 factor (ECF subfamily)
MLFARKNIKNKSLKQFSDEALIQLYKDIGKEIYVAELFQRHAEKVYIIALSQLKEVNASKDLVMTVFEKVIKNLKTTDVKSFSNWLYTITRNECMSKHRSNATYQKKLDEWSNSEKSLTNNVDKDALFRLINREDKAMTKKKLAQALNSLKTNQRTCIQLFYFENKSYKEIASLTGFSDNEIKSYLQHGKKNLRKFLELRN